MICLIYLLPQKSNKYIQQLNFIKMAQTQIKNDVQTQQKVETQQQKLKREQKQRQSKAKALLQQKQRKRIQKQRQQQIKCEDPQYQHYFANNFNNQKSKELMNNIIKSISKQIKNDIKHGSIIIPQQRKSVEEYLQKQKHHHDNDDKKVNNTLIKKLKLQNQLNDLQNQLKKYQKYQFFHSRDDQKLNKSKINQSKSLSPQQNQEHKKFMEKIVKLRLQMEQKRKQYLIFQQNKQKQLQQEEEQQKRLKYLQQKQKKMQRIQEHMKQIEKRRQQSKQQMKEARARIKSVISRKKKYQQMQQAYYQKVVLPSIQEKKKILSDRKQFLNSYNIQDIKQYEIRYLKMKEEAEKNSRNKSIDEWVYKAPPCSQKLIRILQEQKIQERLKIQQKQRLLQDKKSRQQSYKQYLRQKFTIMMNSNKKSKTSSTKLQKNLKNNKQIQPISNGKNLGNKYLQQLKSIIPKRQKAQSQKPAKSQPLTPPPSAQESQLAQKTNPNKNQSSYSKSSLSFCEKNSKKVDKILSSSSLNNQQKIKQLKKQIDKLTEHAKRRQELNRTLNHKNEQQEQLQFLLSSIKAKVSIMQLYNK